MANTLTELSFFREQYIEIIIALRKLGEQVCWCLGLLLLSFCDDLIRFMAPSPQLTQAEKGFLDANDSAMAQMESADKAIGEGIISVVESSVKEAGQ